MEQVTVNLPFDEWLPTQRWYAGRGRHIRSVAPHIVVPLRDDLDLMLLDVDYADGSAERYQLLVRWDTAPIGQSGDVGAIGADGDRTAYDALYDPAVAKYLLALVDQSATVAPLQFTKEPAAELPVDP